MEFYPDEVQIGVDSVAPVFFELPIIFTEPECDEPLGFMTLSTDLT